jgi:hypothetical protein
VVTAQIKTLAGEIFKIDPQIIHLGLIDLEGHVLLDKPAAAPEPLEPDTDRMLFYYQVGLRRSRREHFNNVYGKTVYIHIVREKMQQLVLYLPLITVYMTIDKSTSVDRISKIAEAVINIKKEILDAAIKSTFYFQEKLASQ